MAIIGGPDQGGRLILSEIARQNTKDKVNACLRFFVCLHITYVNGIGVVVEGSDHITLAFASMLAFRSPIAEDLHHRQLAPIGGEDQGGLPFL